MTDKIQIVDFDNKSKMGAAIEGLRRELPEIIRNIEIIAEIRKASYDAHIKKGFTPEQALDLCKTIEL